jgi:predicted DNA-binding protein
VKEKNDTSEKDEVVVSVILPREIYDILEKVTKDRGEVKSTFIRRLIYTELARLSYLDEDKKKALGVEQGENK